MAGLTRAERQRIQRIQARWLDALDASMDRMSAEIRDLARRAIAEIRAAGLTDLRAIRQIVNANLRAVDRLLAEYLAEQVAVAQGYADQVEQVYAIREAAGLETPTQVRPHIEMAAKDASGINAEAAVAKLGAPLRMVGAADRVQTTPAYEAAREILAPRQINLSERLHRVAIHREIRRQVRRSVLVGAQLDETGRELVRYARDLGMGQADTIQLPKILEKLRFLGREINLIGGGDPQLWRAWKKQLRKVERYAVKLKDSRGMYREALRILDKHGPEAIDQALNRWMGEKQRYYAERIVRTESAAAKRAREGDQIAKNRRIVAVIWRMSRGARRGYVRRTKKRRFGGGGARCICETLEGQEFPPSAVAEFPRMGHPHCYCWWERVYRD